MAIRDANGDKLTPTTAAKRIVLHYADLAETWEGSHEVIAVEALTRGERDKVQTAIEKQQARVERLLS